MKRILQKGLILCIRFYQMHISHRLSGCCRYTPSCSEYAIGAIERFGPLKGTALAAWRILRCNPFSRGGYDPVPLTAAERAQGETNKHI